MKKIIVSLACIIFINCCGMATMGTLSQEEKEKITTAIFNAPYLQVFGAAIGVLEDQGYFLEKIDKELGLISTEWKEGAASMAEEILLGNGIRRKISLTITSLDSISTKVKIRGLVQTKTYSGWSGTEEDMSIQKMRESIKKYFDAIRIKLNL
jgi:hypothetical protein